MKPNIFSIATKELSQDGFLTWFIQWADDSCSKYNLALNETAKDFVRLLLNLDYYYPIFKVEAGRQWNNIDIWVEVNEEHFIGIEDKIDTGEHSGQLTRYKDFATDYYKNKKYKLHFIYIKTGNESLSSLSQIKEYGFSIIDRKAILDILNIRNINNDIFNEFKENLIEIETYTNSYFYLSNITSARKAGEGFYVKLQECIPEWTDWKYVPNQMGGFLGFWYHWKETNEIGEMYIQIENSFEKGIKLVIKISDWEQNIDTLYCIFEEIQPYAQKNNLLIAKPARYRAGATSTLAVVQNAFCSNVEGFFNIDLFLCILAKLENTIDEYCENKLTN